jgi:DNA-directed RNA polymerase specialized sigma subunit
MLTKQVKDLYYKASKTLKKISEDVNISHAHGLVKLCEKKNTFSIK